LQTGEYDIAYRVPYDDYEKVNNDPDLDVYTEAYGEIMFMYNTSEGLASDFKMREAINAAINVDDVMKASIVNEDLYWLSPGYMHKEIKAWASDAGEEYYNQNDPEKAKQILDEIGYDGEEFIILTSPDIDYQHNAVIVIQEQLNQIGMNVKLEAVDWPTFLDRMDNNLGPWDALGIASSIVSTPSQLISISPDDGGGVNNDYILDMVDEIETAADRDEAKQLWDELQLYAWEEHLPVTMLGGYNVLFGTTDEIEGFSTFSGPIFWNTSK